MKLTDFQTKIAWGVGILFILCLWMLFPLIFKTLLSAYKLPANFNQFGAFGDIYGSLNTLFTSATLLIVLYSAYLQRQANKDAREAMADQLQEVRDSTSKQLEHATAMSTLQLKQAKEATDKQLELVQKTHDAQIQETKNSFFTSQFYALLNYKNEKFKELSLCDEEDNVIKGHTLFRVFNNELRQRIIVANKTEIENVDENKIRIAFEDTCKKLNTGETYYELLAYFESYSSLIELVHSASMTNKDKKFFWAVIRRSMTSSEQKCIFLLAPMWERLYVNIKKMSIFNSFGITPSFGKYALKFYKKNNFYLQSWSEFFDKNDQKTPA